MNKEELEAVCKAIECIYTNQRINNMFYMLAVEGIVFCTDDIDEHGSEILDAMYMEALLE